MRDPSEKPMVDGIRRGDRAAFDGAFTKFRARVYAFALRLSGRRDVAEDVFQETWLKLARAAPTLREDTDLTAWLFTVVRNEYVSWRRWSMFDLSRLVALGEESDHAARSDALGTSDADAPDARADAARSIARLELGLARLGPSQREVLLLIGVEGLDQEQAAEVLGIRYDALRQRLARARAQLAAEMAKLDRDGHLAAARASASRSPLPDRGGR